MRILDFRRWPRSDFPTLRTAFETFSFDVCCYTYDAGCLGPDRHCPLWQARLLATRDALGWWFRALSCWVRGSHDYVDDSVAGPDHGNISMWCSRCGHSFHRTLY